MAVAGGVQQVSSSSILRHCNYHVFLSFRGADTRKNFTDHLYAALVQAGIQTFRDENEIEKGENIKVEIQRAMLHKSKISLIVLSRNYASSTWCLDELVKIMEHRKSSSQHIVLPIFYDVNPSQVRKQTGSFAEAFARHEEQFKSEMEMVQRWRAALTEVAELGGMVLGDRHEALFLQNIVEEVQNKLRRSTSALHVAPYAVGIENLVKRINWWLADGSKKVGMATICGIGGIGKTTIAKVIYNQNIQRFEGYSFLADVREVCQERNGFVRLQRQLISDILKGKVNKIYNADDGIIKIKEALCGRKVLLVLDDVDDLEKVTKIIGTRIPLHPGSNIILTSRQRYQLRNPIVTQMFDLEAASSYGDLWKVFEVKELGFNESLQLFNWYALGQSSPIDSYMEYARSVVKHCSGLPLALQVLGSSLYGKGIKVWESALEKLEAILDSKVQKILRISYDSLHDDHDKNLFLDIACFFIGKDRDYTTTILDGCDYYTTVGIENLVDRSLVVVNERKKIMMHQMLRDMGREIILQESPEPGKRSRLWRRDAFDVLRDKTGTKRVRSLTLGTFGKTTTTVHLGNTHSKNQSLMSNEVNVETEAFVRMNRLKLLQLDHAKLEGDYKDFPKDLIWLRWHGFHLQSLPLGFDIKRLVALDMRNSSLKHVWKDSTCLPNLKILNLSHSYGLIRTPKFSGLPSLERLMLKECIKLIEVDQSICELKRLTFFDLKDCKSLCKLPRTIGMLLSLKELILSGCSRLDDIPRELQNMKSLKVLKLDETAINQSSSWLPWLPLKRNKGLCLFWASLPYSLVKLSLKSCRLSDEVMPNDLSSLASLKYLNLSRNPFRIVPKSIGNLIKLDELVLTSCKELQVIPNLPILKSITDLILEMSPSSVLFSSLFHLLSLKRCIIFGCEKLTEVEGVFKLEQIESFEVEPIKSLFNLAQVESHNVQIYNCLTDTRISSSQVLHECGITSTFVLGNAVPISFEHRSKEPQIAFSLPPLSPCKKISWLKLCIVFSLVSDQILPTLPSVYISNETKETRRIYFSSFIGIPETKNNTILWLIHWPVMDFQLDGGDTVSCRVIPVDFVVKEFGVSWGSQGNFQHNYLGNNDEHMRTRNFELQEITNLFNLDCLVNVEVQIYNYSEESKATTSPQVLYHCGMIKEFDPSNDISYCLHLAPSPKISFTVPPKSCQKINGLQSIIYLSSNSDDETLEFLVGEEIVNETKDTKWSHCKHFVGFGDTKNNLTLFSIWRFSGEIEAGDQVSFMVHSDLRLTKYGIELVYEDEIVSDNNTVHKSDSLDCYFRGSTKCLNHLLVTYIYHLFKSHRTFYRMQSLDED